MLLRSPSVIFAPLSQALSSPSGRFLPSPFPIAEAWPGSPAPNGGYVLRTTRERPWVKNRRRQKKSTSIGEAAINVPASSTGKLEPP